MELKALIKWVQAQDHIKKRQILSPSGSHRGMHLYYFKKKKKKKNLDFQELSLNSLNCLIVDIFSLCRKPCEILQISFSVSQ